MASISTDPLGVWRLLSFAMALGVSTSLMLLACPVAARTRQLRTWGALAMLGALESIYLLTTLALLLTKDGQSRMFWARLSFLPMPLTVYLLWHLTLEVTLNTDRAPWRRSDRWALLTAVTLTATVFLDLFADLGLVVRGVRLLPGTLRHLVIVTGPVGASFFLAALALLASALALLARAGQPREHPLWPVAAGALVFLVALANDVALVFGIYDAPFLNHLGFLALYAGFTVCFGYAFVSRSQMLRAANAELRQHRRAAVHASRLRSMGTLAAFVAHELGNDLQTVESILAGMELSPSPDLQEGDLEDLKFATRHMGGVLRGLRRMSRDAAQDPMEPTSLTEVTQDALRMMAPALRRAGVDVALDAPDDDVLVLGRPPELMQVLLNLLGNAVDAVDAVPRPRVALRLTRDGSLASVRVTDNGPGVPEAVAAQIFTPFFTTKPAGEGTGIGLAVVRQIVSDHGGSITVDRAQETTVFEVRLPLAGPAPATSPSPPHGAPSSSERVSASA